MHSYCPRHSMILFITIPMPGRVIITAHCFRSLPSLSSASHDMPSWCPSCTWHEEYPYHSIYTPSLPQPSPSMPLGHQEHRQQLEGEIEQREAQQSQSPPLLVSRLVWQPFR